MVSSYAARVSQQLCPGTFGVLTLLLCSAQGEELPAAPAAPRAVLLPSEGHSLLVSVASVQMMAQ